MNTNNLSAFVLASLACLSAACVNTSATEGMSNDELVLDIPADSSDDKVKNSDIHGKPLSLVNQLVMSPDDAPFGATYKDWTAAYWQWAMSIPADTNPILDGPCDQNQSGDVFFLAGAMGGGHHRSCTIPRGKAILIPILSSVARACPEMVDELPMCEDAMKDEAIGKRASVAMDLANPLLTLRIDGELVQDLNSFRVLSNVFTDTSPKNPDDRLFPSCSGSIEANICGVSEGEQRPAVSAGYFVMLRYLPDGPHQIHIAANVSPDSPEAAFEVTYNIFVSWPGPNNATD